jgi:hypothetical protein
MGDSQGSQGSPLKERETSKETIHRVDSAARKLNMRRYNELIK